jgi:hypothetical protein
MSRSEQINELAASLAVAQGAMSVAIKDSTNPHFKSRYADLASVIDAVRPHLSANGICFVQEPTTEAGMVVVETTLYHKSGQWISSKLSVACKDLSPQPVGSATTYARRYALMAICGIAPAEDDDGESAQGRPQPTRPVLPPKAPPPAEPKSEAPTGKPFPRQTDKPELIDAVRSEINALNLGQDPARLARVAAILRATCTRLESGKLGSVPAEEADRAALVASIREVK